MSLAGYSEQLFGYNTLNKNNLAADSLFVKAVLVPLGGVIAWLKTFVTADSGTTTSTSANHLVQTGQNFLTTCQVGYIVRNTTDSTWSYITAVNSDTDLTLAADIMTTGENFTIYTTPYLPDGWAECNGQVISDSDSVFNGATIPNLNASGGGTQRFLRGSTTSGSTGGEDTHVLTVAELAAHTHTIGQAGVGGGNAIQPGDSGTTTTGSTGSNTAHENRPPYYEAVWIIRIK